MLVGGFTNSRARPVSSCHAEPVQKLSEVEYVWRGPLTDVEMVSLVEAHGGTAVVGWWDRVREHSLGWVTARQVRDLIGFVNVAWDGDAHAFLLDTKTRSDRHRQGVGERLVALAAENARAAGCEWLHVDFTPDLAAFYVDACGFRPTHAGLIHLTARD
jgi:GNAT superfamily N-acetyltransferase